MATIRRFEDLEVWQMAQQQCDVYYKLVCSGCLRGHYPLQDQMDRSSASVMDNIAEGFDRHIRADFRHFLVMARGSNAEFRSQLYRCTDRGIISPETFGALKTQSERLGVKLHHFIGYLLWTEIKEKPTPPAPQQAQEEAPVYSAEERDFFLRDLPDEFFNPPNASDRSEGQ